MTKQVSGHQALCKTVKLDFTEVSPRVADDIQVLLRATKSDAADHVSQILGLCVEIFVFAPFDEAEAIIVSLKPNLTAGHLDLISQALPIVGEDLFFAVAEGAALMRLQNTPRAQESYGRKVALSEISKHHQIEIRNAARQRLTGAS